MTSQNLAAKIRHIVVLMLENRSFDHILGALRGAEGVLDAGGRIRSDLFNLTNPLQPGSKRYTPKLGAIFVTPEEQRTHKGQETFGGPSHSFPSGVQQLFGVKTVNREGEVTTPFHGGSPVTSPASNSGFVLSFAEELKQTMGADRLAAAQQAGQDPVEEVMQVFTPDQLPAIYTLAQEFCVCDHWFSELPGPTEPNRLFTHAATSTGLTYNPWNLDPITVPTIYDRISQAGKDWTFYAYDLNDSTNFAALLPQPQANLKFAQFFTDAVQGKLPFYSFLCPRYNASAAGRPSSQHAPDDIRFGDKLIADVYQAVRNGPDWETTLLIITYDEHGGYFDHVPPPAVAPPDNFVSPNAFMQHQAQNNPQKSGYLVKPENRFDFSRLGFRVPAVLVSPWIPAGTVDSTEYRHTSMLRLVGDLLGTAPLTKRDATAKSFGPVLSLPSPRGDCPASVSFAELPADNPGAVLAAAPTPIQEEVARRYTTHLAGHPETGSVTQRTFATNADLSRYVEMRLQRAEWARNGTEKGASFSVVEVQPGQWQWRLCDARGEVLASSPKSYSDAIAAGQALEQVRFLSHMLDEPKVPGHQ
jgi:phospholipase C